MRSRLKSVFNRFNKLNEERGAVIPAVMVMLLMGCVLLIPQMLSFTNTGVMSGNMYGEEADELYAADAGASDALWLLAVNSAYSDEEVLALIAQVEDGDPEKHIYDLPDTVDNNTVHIEISIVDDYYVILSTATSPDGDSTTVEVWAKPPVLPEAELFSAVSLDGSLKLQSDLGTYGKFTGEAVGTGDGVTTQFELDCKSIGEETEVIDPIHVHPVTEQVNYQPQVWVGGALQDRKINDEDEVYDYEINWQECTLEFDDESIPQPGLAVVATYGYCQRVNLYANGDINIQGASCKVFGDVWCPIGSIVTYDQCKMWYGETIYTRRLRIATSAIPEMPETLIVGNYTANGGTIGDVHITGTLTFKGDVTVTGTVWADGGIGITAAGVTVTGINPVTGNPYFLVSPKTGPAISFTGGYVEGLLYAPNGEVDIGGGASLFGAAVSWGDIDCMGSSNLINALPLERAPYGFFPMDVQTWKIT